MTESPGRIFILEPNETDLTNMTILLQRAGYSCTSMSDGLEAIKALGVNQYDLAIHEVQIPGYEELELVQAMERYAPGMPTIIYTAHPSMRSAIASIRLPVAAYLIKPVHPNVLLQHIETSIADYKASKRRESLLQRTIVYTWAIEETIQVLEATRSSSKSNQLAVLRRQLERILDSEQNEIRQN